MDWRIQRTERLILSPFAVNEVAALWALFRDPEVRRFLLDDSLVDQQWMLNEISHSQDRFANSSLGLWSIRELPSGADGSGPIIGFTGFRPFFEPPQLQLLYGLSPHVWGRGFATEAAAAAVACAFTQLELQSVIAAADQPNRASHSVMKRLGMSPWKTTDQGAAGTLFCKLTREQWLSQPRQF